MYQASLTDAERKKINPKTKSENVIAICITRRGKVVCPSPSRRDMASRIFLVVAPTTM